MHPRPERGKKDRISRPLDTIFYFSGWFWCICGYDYPRVTLATAPEILASAWLKFPPVTLDATP